MFENLFSGYRIVKAILNSKIHGLGYPTFCIGNQTRIVLDDECDIESYFSGKYESVPVFSSEGVVMVKETTIGFFVKPGGKCFKSQFESFFDFDCCNMGYNPNRTVFIPK